MLKILSKFTYFQLIRKGPPVRKGSSDTSLSLSPRNSCNAVSFPRCTPYSITSKHYQYNESEQNQCNANDQSQYVATELSQNNTSKHIKYNATELSQYIVGEPRQNISSENSQYNVNTIATYHHNGHDSKCHCDKNINTGSVDTTAYHDSKNIIRNVDNQPVRWCDSCSIDRRKMWLNPEKLASNCEEQILNNDMVPMQSKPLFTGVVSSALSTNQF